MRTISKRGGAVAGSANVLWGADFGESSDDNTFTVGVNIDLDVVAIENNKTVGVSVTMPELIIIYNEKAVGVNIDIEDIAIEYNKSIGVNIDLDDVALENDKIVGVNIIMPELAIENNKTVGVHLSGTARGAPFWQSIQTTNSSTAGTSIIITKPVGMVVGDLMVALVGHNTNEVVTAPTGWVEIRQQGQTGTLQCHLAAFYKIVVSGDSVITNYTFTWTTSGAFFGSIQHLTAADTPPINTSAATASSVTDPVAPALTTSSTNCFLIAACIQNSAVGLTYTPPSGYVERADQDGLGTAGAHLLDGEVATKVQAASGAVATATMDSSTLVAVDSVAMHIAISSGLLVIAS